LSDSGDDEVVLTVVASLPATVVFGVTAVDEVVVGVLTVVALLLETVVFGVTAAGASAAAVLLATDGVVDVVELPPPVVDELFDGAPYA